MSYEQAAKEAFVTCPVDEVYYDTIELIHPAFVDSSGNPITLRAVNGADPIQARLELSAPHDAGQVVEFRPIGFEVDLPGFSKDQTPTMKISISNLSREAVTYIEQGSTMYDPIKMIYRPYLESRLLVGPDLNPPYEMQLGNVMVDVFRITATATMPNISNRAFPYLKYTLDKFKGLRR